MKITRTQDRSAKLLNEACKDGQTTLTTWQQHDLEKHGNAEFLIDKMLELLPQPVGAYSDEIEVYATTDYRSKTPRLYLSYRDPQTGRSCNSYYKDGKQIGLNFNRNEVKNVPAVLVDLEAKLAESRQRLGAFGEAIEAFEAAGFQVTANEVDSGLKVYSTTATGKRKELEFHGTENNTMLRFSNFYSFDFTLSGAIELAKSFAAHAQSSY